MSQFLAEGVSPSAGHEVSGVAYAECYCGQVEAFPESAGLPTGWAELGQERALCPDCRRGEQLDLIPSSCAKTGYHGCRLLHSIVSTDAVVIRIYAGANPLRPSVDRPIHFVARAEDLAALISRLSAIKKSLKRRAQK